jgi:hypothetical protein
MNTAVFGWFGDKISFLYSSFEFVDSLLMVFLVKLFYYMHCSFLSSTTVMDSIA